MLALDEQDKQKYAERTARLRKAMVAARKRMRPILQARQEILKQYTGTRFSDEETFRREKFPLNLIEMTINVWVRNFISRTPRAMVSTNKQLLKPSARKLELAMDYLFDEIRFGETLSRVVMEALCGIGVAITGIEYEGSVEYMGFTHDTGRPFCDSIPADDFVFDVNAPSFERCTFMGHRTRIPLDAVRNNPRFDEQARAQVQATPFKGTDKDGSTKKSNSLLGETSVGREELYEYVDVWQVYLPLENKICWFPDDQEHLILDEQDYIGPKEGPYELLTFESVCGNCMPLPPLLNLLDLNEATNRVYSKANSQAKRQKVLTMVLNGAQKDGERVVSGRDGQTIMVDDPNSVREIRYGGVDNVTFSYAMHLKQLFSYMAGNLDALGGLAPGADTLGQDKLLAGAASKKIQDMQDKMKTFTERVVNKLAWGLVSEPFVDLPISMKIGEFEMPTRFRHEDVRGDFLDYNFTITPYSLHEPTPSERLAVVDQTMQIAAAMAQSNPQSGVVPNTTEYLALRARLTNTPEIMDMFMFQGTPPSGMEGGVTPQKAALPGVPTERTYRRISQSATSQNPEMAMQMQLMGSGGMANGMAGKPGG